MHRSVGVLAAITAALYASGAAAQRSPQAPDTVREQFFEEIPVSAGAVLVGLTTDDDGPRLPHGQLLAFVPATGAADSLCVTIRSQDGRYQGDFHYALRRTGSGTVLLDVRTRRPKREIERYGLESLAVLARVGASCARAREPLVAVSWVNTTRPQHLKLQALAASPTHRVQAVLVAGTPQPFSCPATGGAQDRAFNRVCRVDLPTAPGERELRLLSGLPHRPNPPLRLRLYVP